MHSDVIEKLKLWNSDEHKNKRNLDGRFALAIYLSLSSNESIADGKMNEDIKNFIKGNF